MSCDGLNEIFVRSRDATSEDERMKVAADLHAMLSGCLRWLLSRFTQDCTDEDLAAIEEHVRTKTVFNDAFDWRGDHGDPSAKNWMRLTVHNKFRDILDSRKRRLKPPPPLPPPPATSDEQLLRDVLALLHPLVKREGARSALVRRQVDMGLEHAIHGLSDREQVLRHALATPEQLEDPTEFQRAKWRLEQHRSDGREFVALSLQMLVDGGHLSHEDAARFATLARARKFFRPDPIPRPGRRKK